MIFFEASKASFLIWIFIKNSYILRGKTTYLILFENLCKIAKKTSKTTFLKFHRMKSEAQESNNRTSLLLFIYWNLNLLRPKQPWHSSEISKFARKKNTSKNLWTKLVSLTFCIKRKCSLKSLPTPSIIS